jgi:hypothetical protein
MNGRRRGKLARGALAASVFATSVVAAAEPPAPFGVEARVAHIASTLTAVAEASPAALEEEVEYARTLERGACSAGSERLRVECLLIASARYCHDRTDAEAPRCTRTMDVVLSNVLADRRLIPNAKRYEIIRANRDYRPALARELLRIQGTIAIDFRLHSSGSSDVHAIATDIDRYCLGGGDDATLTYPACVSSLVWFIEAPHESREDGPVRVAPAHSSPTSEPVK